MPKCSVKKCKNHTSYSLKKHGVSYFRFPKNEILREKWRKIIAAERDDEFFKPTDSSVVCSSHFAENDVHYSKKGLRKINKGALPRVELKQPVTSGSNKDALETETGFNVSESKEPHGVLPLHQCRLCAKSSKDCIDVTDQDRPYLTRNKTTLSLNDLSVELDFDDDTLPKTVCGTCDRKLQAVYDFFKQVNEAQELLVNVKDDFEEVEILIVKTECESPTSDDNVVYNFDKDPIGDSIPVNKTVFVKPSSKCKRKSVEDTLNAQKKPKVTAAVESGSHPSDDNEVDDMDSKDGIVDSITVSETVLIKPSSQCKKESVEDTPNAQKKPKATADDVESEGSELLIDIKEEPVGVVDAYEAENSECYDSDTVTE